MDNDKIDIFMGEDYDDDNDDDLIVNPALIMTPTPPKRFSFMPDTLYCLQNTTMRVKNHINLQFIETARGFGERRHHIFRYPHGYLISFTDEQLLDYEITEV